MKKYLHLAYLLFVYFAAAVLLTAFLAISNLQTKLVSAQSPCPENMELLYFEDFEKWNGRDWTLDPGWGVITDADGNHVLSGKDHWWAAYIPGYWAGDAPFFSMFRFRNLQGGVHTVFSRNDQGRYYLSLANEGNGRLKFDLNKQYWPDQFFPQLAVEYYDNFNSEAWLWGSILLLKADISASVTDYDVTLPRLATRLPYTPTLRYADPDPLGPGTIAFETLDNSAVLIDDIRVCGVRLYPDLVIVQANNHWLEDNNQTLAVEVVVANRGGYPSPPTTISADNQDQDWPGAAGDLAALNPGQSSTLTLRQPIPPGLLGKTTRLRIIVDPGNLVVERNKDNNTVWTEPFDLPVGPGLITPRPRSISTPTHVPSPGRPPSGIITLTASPGDRQGPVIPPGVLVGVGAIVLIWVIYKVVRGSRKGQRGREPEKPIPLPPLPLRLVRIWLTEGGTGTGKLLPDSRTLAADSLYSLHLQVQVRGKSQPQPGLLATTQLDVVFFSQDAEVEMERKPAQLELPGQGSSNMLVRPFRPRRAGECRIRANIYYCNTLLQSTVLEARVVEPGGRGAAGAGTSPNLPGASSNLPAVTRQVDYVASASLAGLERLSRPALNIFTNQAGEQDWIGIYSGGSVDGKQLAMGDVLSFSQGDLAGLAQKARSSLAQIEGERVYRLADAFPLDVEKLRRREDDLVSLAVSGYELFDILFKSGEYGIADDRLERFVEVLQAPGVISIANCRAGKSALPWAALYQLPLDTGRAADLRLCQIFKDQLLVNRWSPDGTQVIEIHDLLDQPLKCRENPLCPLKGADPQRTVCPYGFWGFFHHVEQPLQQVTPVSVDEIPEELRTPQYNQTAFIITPPGGSAVKAVMGAYPGIPDAVAHAAELDALFTGSGGQFIYETDRNRIFEWVKQGGQHLFYFYCHGLVDAQVFKLKLGPVANPGTISSADLDPLSIHWPEQPQPLVILNGCETLALTPEVIHGFLGKLRRLGASGAVGSEIKIWTPLAHPFGLLLVKGLVEGKSLGEAFLDARRQLLRLGNPLGLAFTFYAPENLHLHDPAHCAWCQAHGADTL